MWYGVARIYGNVKFNVANAQEECTKIFENDGVAFRFTAFVVNQYSFMQFVVNWKSTKKNCMFKTNST